MLHDIVKACRSYRRFDERERIDHALLVSWVDAARLVASSGNAQPLRYAIIDDEAGCERVFACCTWAKALADWDGPEPGEHPSAYIVVCRDLDRALTDTFTTWDEGIAAQTIMLQAAEAGFRRLHRRLVQASQPLRSRRNRHGHLPARSRARTRQARRGRAHRRRAERRIDRVLAR